MAQTLVFMERSDSFYSFPPASKEHVEINRVKFNYGRSRLPVLFWCTISLKKYRHILAKDYTLIHFKGRYAANMQKGISLIFVCTKELEFCPYYLCISICCADFHQFYSGGHIHFGRAVSIQFCL